MTHLYNTFGMFVTRGSRTGAIGQSTYTTFDCSRPSRLECECVHVVIGVDTDLVLIYIIQKTHTKSVARFNTVAADRDVYVKNRRLQVRRSPWSMCRLFVLTNDSIQALMLKWTVAVYSLIDNLERLHSL